MTDYLHSERARVLHNFLWLLQRVNMRTAANGVSDYVTGMQRVAENYGVPM